MKHVFALLDASVIYAQLRRKHPTQPRCKSLRIAVRACWPN